MNTHPAAASGSEYFYAPRSSGQSDGAAKATSGKGLGRLAPAIAFFVMVFASMAAAATVVSEAPLMLVGLY
ncbi:MAG: hypothetical protein V4718_00490 [Pseudomonadota bacterium]